MYEAGRTRQVAMEMKRYGIKVLGISETRWLQSGQIRLATGEQLLYSGHTMDEAPHTEGVGLMLAPGSLQRSLLLKERTSTSTLYNAMLQLTMQMTKRKMNSIYNYRQ